MNIKSDILTLSVTKTGLSVCLPAKGDVVEMAFDPNILVNMEIVDLPKLSAKVAAFVAQYQIKPTEVVMIIDADICFVKKIESQQDEQISKEVQEFLDCVPISSPSYKLFKVGNESTLIVINRRLYEYIRQAFGAAGFNVTAVVPETILLPLGVATDLNVNSCSIMTKNMSFVRQNSFVFPPTIDKSPSWVKRHGKLAALFSILGIVTALLVVGFVIWQIQSSKAQAVARAQARAATIARVAVPTPSPIPSSIPQIDISQLTLKVFNASTIRGAAGKIALQLANSGYAKAEVGDAPESQTTSVVVSPKVSQIIRDQVLELVTKSHTKPTISENTQAQFDIIITLGKSTP